MFGGNIILVANCDVLSFASVYPDSFAAESTDEFLVGTACTVRELSGTPGACFPFPCCCVSSSCARDCVFLTRDMACTTAQVNLTCPSHPAW